MVDVARQLFAKNGVDDTTMNDNSGGFQEGKTHALYVFQEQRRHLYGSGGVGVRDGGRGRMEKVLNRISLLIRKYCG